MILFLGSLCGDLASWQVFTADNLTDIYSLLFCGGFCVLLYFSAGSQAGGQLAVCRMISECVFFLVANDLLLLYCGTSHAFYSVPDKCVIIN